MNSRYKQAKEIIKQQTSMKDLEDACKDKDNKGYFYLCSNNFLKPKTDSMYREIRSLDQVEGLAKVIESSVSDCKVKADANKLRNNELEVIKENLAQLELGMWKVISLHKLVEYACSVNKIFELLEVRDEMYEEISGLRGQTIESRRTMSD